MITERLPDGTLVVMTAQGWRPATPEEQNALEVGRGEAWAMSGLRGVLDMNNLATLANPFTFMGGGDVRQQAVAGATEGLQERASTFTPLQAAQPGATAAGAFYADPLNAAGMGVGAFRLGRGMLARRVMQQAQQQAGAAAAATAAPGATAGAGMGATSVGAASTGAPEAALGAERSLVSRLIAAPGQFYDDTRQAIDELLRPMDLTPDQRQMIPVAQRLGFRFLPGQVQGSSGIAQMASSDPLVGLAFQGELGANRQGVRAAAARAIGQMSDDFSRDMLGQAADRIGAQLDDIGRQVGEVQLGDDVAERIAQVAKSEPFLQIRGGATLSGDEAMALRSQLNQAASNAWKAGANAPAGKAEFIEEIVMALDDAIEGRLTDAQRIGWKRAREQWKNLKVLESPNVVNQLGEINVRSLSTQLGRYYKGAFARQVTGEGGRRAGLEAGTRDLMDWARLGAQFGDNFPNSGTAYRTRLMQVATNPVELAKSIALRGTLELAMATR